MSGNAVWLSGRGVVRVSGPDAAGFLQGILTNDVETLGASRGALCRAADAAGKNPVRFSGRAAAGRGWLFARLQRGASEGTGKAARLLQAEGQGSDRRRKRKRGRGCLWSVGVPPTTSTWRSTRRARSVTPIRARTASANARSCRSPRRRRSARGRCGLRRPARLARRARGRARFRLWRRVPARRQSRSHERRRFREGLLCRPGGRVAHAASRRRAGRAIVRVKLGGEAPPPGTAIVDGELPVGALGGASGREALALVRTDRAEDARRGRPTVDGRGRWRSTRRSCVP